MNHAHGRRAAAVAALALVPLLAAGCNKKISLPTVMNERPLVRLTAAPIDTIGPDGKRATYVYHYKLNWVGYDPDGRVDHFLYTIDPPGSPGGGLNGVRSECGTPTAGDTAWCSTTLNEKEIFFSAAVPVIDPGGAYLKNPLASDIHTFVIKSVDNQGMESAPVYRSFFSFTQAPTIQIQEPTPIPILYQKITPFVTVHWLGDDPDGVFTQKPVKYKFHLYSENDNIFPVHTKGMSDYDFMLSQPDSLRRLLAPSFVGWDSSSADTTFATFTNLTPDTRYAFVVVGYDEAGAYSPIFNLSTNMVKLLVTFAGNFGPILTIFNEFFNFHYASGGFSTDPSRYINLEIPARQPVHFNWTADAPNGSQMKQYRWAMDITNLDDQTPRTDERTDFKHWSQWGLDNISATVGPFNQDTTHIFYIEAEDVNGLTSLGIVSFRVVVPTFNHDLLIVNDTRLFPDNAAYPPDLGHPDSLAAPIGPWPSRAELDTFFFARGGVRWRMTPDGTLSPPGIFAGYKYDTVYTKAGGTNGFVTLDTLGRYKHVIWFTESNSATGNNNILGDGVLHQMSEPGRANTLAAYVTLGGRVWLFGGTSIQATMLPWNNPANDSDPPAGVQKFSVTASPGKVPELGPGKMVFDQAHWRSDIWLYGIDTAFPHKSKRAVGGYPSRIDPRWGLVRSPDYSLLPTLMGPKTQVTDPTPPNRGIFAFFSDVSVFNLEFMTSGNPGALSNPILENVNPNPDSTTLVSMLDTLMIAPLNFNGVPRENEDLSQAGKYYASFPVMTYYHGFDNPPFVLTGFDMWTFTHGSLVQMVDFVLQQIWGLPKTPIVAPAVSRAPVATRLPAAPPAAAARIRR